MITALTGGDCGLNLEYENCFQYRKQRAYNASGRFKQW